MPASHPGFLERHEQAEAQHFFAKIPLVQIGFQNRFVKMLEFGQGELWRQQLEPNRLVTHLALQPGQGHGQDLRVIERQLGHLRNWEPFGVRRIRGGLGPVVRRV